MSAFDELAAPAWADFSGSGQLTDAVAKLLLALMESVARFGTTGPPGDYERWCPEAVEEAVLEFLAHPRTPRRLTTIRVRSDSARGFRLQLEASIKNWLRDEARRSNRGHVIERIRTVMSSADEFHQAPAAGAAAWAIGPDAAELYSGPTGNLFDAARAVTNVERVYWDGERRDPIASPDDLHEVLEAVLTEAGAAVDEALLSEVIAYRFGVNAGPDATPVPPDSDVWSPQRIHDPVEEQGIVNVEAASLWPLLNDRVRSFLAVWDLEPAEAQAIMGLGRTRAYEYRAEAIDTLKSLLRDHPKGQEIVVRLTELARAWFQERTSPPGDSSDTATR